MLAAAAQVVGCQSARIDDIVPDPTVPRLQASDSGAFPNLNVEPTPEAPQLTEAQRSAKVAELRAAQSGQSASAAGPAPASEAQMRKIGATHAEETLRAIEGQKPAN